MAENTPVIEPQPSPPKADWARATMWMVIVFVIALNSFFFLKSCRDVPGETIDKAGRLIKEGGKTLTEVMAAFKQGRITTEFISYASSISPTHHLQFATLKQQEIFTRKDAASTGFGYVPLPDLVVEARAPVETTYFLDLNARWQIVVTDGVVHVTAPDIRFNAPAVDASEIRYEVRKDSAFRNTTAAMEGLKMSVTALAKERARENISLVRETGRRQTAEFVEKWLLTSFADGKKYPVKVYFPDEAAPAGLAFTNAPGR